MRRWMLVLVVLAAVGLVPVTAEGKPDCTWGDTIMTLAHIQAQVDAQEAGDAHALIAEADAALQADSCFSP
ncbi:MAG TPA: hypothetical protein VHD90_25320 [Phototrophicaceae bacterium]|nr:hypothetical protein [Phototrophicaceae bacterium]